jgi:DNA polymerase I-like protein with 3'-5' exonuclease and polymerase domains
MKIVLDIETNSTHDKIWCVVTRDIETDEVIVWKQASGLQKYLDDCGLIIMHNGIAFDAPTIRRCWNVTTKLSQVCDTLVLSRLLNPSLEGGHSLAAWAMRVGSFKAPYKKIWSWMTGINTFEDKKHVGYNGYKQGQEFDKPILNLLEQYCIQDTLVTKQLYNHLVKTLQSENFSQRSIDLEHNVQAIIAKQETNGFKFDEPKALQLLALLKTKLDTIQTEMQLLFPAKVTSGRTHKTSGKALADIIEPFNPGSRKQIAERLIEKGWKPKKHTEKGSVIVDESVLETLDFPEAKTLAEYMMLQKRIAQIESWIEAIQPDGRVHGKVITNGAVTGRMTHHSPNMAQVPNSGSPFGEDCRELWTVEKGYKLVGIDASGLELRMLAHYMNDDAYTSEVVSGDIHTANQKAAGLETRNQAKTFIYAFLYGAGASKIGTVVGGSAREGQKLIDTFLKNTPKLRDLRNKVISIYSKETRLPGLDGRQLLVRSEHSALNTLLQGAGSIAMKQALVIFNKELRNAKIDFKFVANVHDEWQIEVEESRAEEVGMLGVKAITNAGIELSMRCPLTGEYKVGNNWKETH